MSTSQARNLGQSDEVYSDSPKVVDLDKAVRKALHQILGNGPGEEAYRDYRLYRRENHHLNLVFSAGWVALNSIAERLAIIKAQKKLPDDVISIAIEARRMASILRHKWHEFNMSGDEDYWQRAIENLWSARTDYCDAEQDLVAQFLEQSARATREEWVQRIDELLLAVGKSLTLSNLGKQRPDSDAPTKSAISEWLKTGHMSERPRKRGVKKPLGARDRLKSAVKDALSSKFSDQHNALVDSMPGRWTLSNQEN